MVRAVSLDPTWIAAVVILDVYQVRENPARLVWAIRRCQGEVCGVRPGLDPRSIRWDIKPPC